ncbi:unnamed protein product [Cercospora beticola]|nr:unnamed protein product [Cercospora beticola]
MLLCPPQLDRRGGPINYRLAHSFGRSSISHSNETYTYRNGTSPLEPSKTLDQPWTNEAGICPSGEFAFRNPKSQPIPWHEDQRLISKCTLLTKRHPNATTSAAASLHISKKKKKQPPSTIDRKRTCETIASRAFPSLRINLGAFCASPVAALAGSKIY